MDRIDDIIDNEDAIQYSDDDIYYSEILKKTIGEIMTDVTLDNFAYDRGELWNCLLYTSDAADE